MCGEICKSWLKNELHWKNLRLSDIDRRYLYTSRWNWNRAAFPIYRTILGLYTLTVFLIRITKTYFGWTSWQHWATYLSNWHYFMFTLYFCYAMAMTLFCNIRDHRREITDSVVGNIECGDIEMKNGQAGSTVVITAQTSDDAGGNKVPWYLQIQWLLFNIAAFSAIPISLLYYAYIFPQIKDRYLASNFRLFIDINFHAFNSGLIILDIIISNVKLRFYHALYGALFVVIYITFNVIYWALDPEKNIIYSILEWSKPLMPSVLVVGGIFGGVLIWIVLCLFQRGLSLIQVKKCSQEMNSDTEVREETVDELPKV